MVGFGTNRGSGGEVLVGILRCCVGRVDGSGPSALEDPSCGALPPSLPLIAIYLGEFVQLALLLDHSAGIFL